MEFKVNTAKKTAHPTFFLKLLSRLFRVCGTSVYCKICMGGKPANRGRTAVYRTKNTKYLNISNLVAVVAVYSEIVSKTPC